MRTLVYFLRVFHSSNDLHNFVPYFLQLSFTLVKSFLFYQCNTKNKIHTQTVHLFKRI
jgi:hypothetical protein